MNKDETINVLISEKAKAKLLNEVTIPKVGLFGETNNFTVQVHSKGVHFRFYSKHTTTEVTFDMDVDVTKKFCELEISDISKCTYELPITPDSTSMLYQWKDSVKGVLLQNHERVRGWMLETMRDYYNKWQISDLERPVFLK